MSVGSTLKEMRKSAGFTVEQLAKRSRIPASVIEDLEKDNFQTAGGPTYARGNIKRLQESVALVILMCLLNLNLKQFL